MAVRLRGGGLFVDAFLFADGAAFVRPVFCDARDVFPNGGRECGGLKDFAMTMSRRGFSDPTKHARHDAATL